MSGKYWTKAGNVTWGCTPASEACQNCYAKTQHDRYHEAAVNRAAAVPGIYRAPFNQVQQRPKVMNDFAKWKNEVVFVSNMSDLFHESVPFEYIGKVFEQIIKNRHNTYLILTKRADRMREFMKDCQFRIDMESSRIGGDIDFRDVFDHVWLGVTAENQQRADERIPLLLDTPAAHRWVSAEPLLSAIKMRYGWLSGCDFCCNKDRECDVPRHYYRPQCPYCHGTANGPHVDLVIAGGESGRNARASEPEWFEDLYEQCGDAGVRFYLKQFGDAYRYGDDDPYLSFGEDALAQPFIGRSVA